MRDALLTGLGGAILLAAMAAGWLRWLRPRRAHLGIQGQGLLLLVLLTLMGGSIGAPFWWMDPASSFSWNLPPLAGRMLASAALAFATVSFLALERPTVRRLRLVMLLVAVYLGPLLVAVLAFHLDRFNFGRLITYSFFAVVGGMTIASLWYLARWPAGFEDPPEDSNPPDAVTQAWLGAVAALTALWGVALFATDDGPSKLVWVWPGDLLTSRLIGVMLLTIASGSVYALRSATVARLMLVAQSVYGLGVMAAGLWSALEDKPVKHAYVFGFGAIYLGAAALLLADRALAARQVRPHTA